MKSRHKIHNLAYGIKIQEYNNGSYAYWIEDRSYWRNIPAELGKVLVKALRKKEWILISEALPNNDRLVNILFSNGEVSSGEYYRDGWYDCSIEEYVDESHLGGNVIAWMELPKGNAQDDK